MDGSTGSQQALISQCYSRRICHQKGLFTAQRKRVSFVEIEWGESHDAMIPTVTVRYVKRAGRSKRKKRENPEKEGRERTVRSLLDPQSACVSS